MHSTVAGSNKQFQLPTDTIFIRRLCASMIYTRHGGVQQSAVG